MDCFFAIREDKIADECGTWHSTYGIDIVINSRVVESVPDILLDRNRMQELINTCNKLKLSPKHIMDVISDIINL